MSRNAVAGGEKVQVRAEKRKVDRRVRQTRDALGDALMGLMHEKPFGAITVQQVLDRAKVGRSTFYSHYRDKDDLLLSDAEEFFEGMSTLLLRSGEASNRVAPAREFFAHVAEMRVFHSALVTSGKIKDVMEMGEEYFARGIARQLGELPSAGGIRGARRDALGHALAGALISLLSWWIAHGKPGSPEEMDDLYHRIVWSGGALWGEPRGTEGWLSADGDAERRGA